MVKILKLLTALGFLAVLAVWFAGSYLTAETNHPLAMPAGLNAQAVVIDGVHGWYNGLDGASSCVLLLHGIRSDRTSMVARSIYLRKKGFVSLLIDLQAHGETKGDGITFGYRESVSARAAVAYLKNTQHCQKIAVIGMSLGGAASVLGFAPLEVDAFILEAVYPTIEEAVVDRLAVWVGPLAPLAAPLLYYQLPLRLGIPLDSLRPIAAIKNIRAPVLIMGGSKDRHTTPAETQHLFDSAPLPKQLWIVEGAAHEDFYSFAGREYEEKIFDFLKRYL